MITLASNRGAYIILDLHRYRAPKPEFLEFWKDAATRYKDHPALIFDLMNEPHGVSWEIWRNGGFVGEKTDADQAAFLSAEDKAKAQGFQSPGMQAMLDAVRSTGAKNVVLVGALDYAYQLDGILNGFALDDKSGNGIMYSSHVYPWKKGWQKKLLDAAALHPILLGEVGAIGAGIRLVLDHAVGLGNVDSLLVGRFVHHADAGRRRLIDRMRGIEAEHGHCFWALTVRDNDALIGWCGVIPGKDGPIAGKAEIGWRVASDCWGQGYASEAVACALEWADTRFDRTVAMINPANATSISVARRCGFAIFGEATYRAEPVGLWERSRPA